jgi:hypothetical protein
MGGLLDYPNGAAFGVGSPAETSQQPAGMAGLLGGAFDALGLLAKRAFGASEMMRQGGAYDAGPILEAATLPMGTGAIAGVPVRAGEAVLGAGPIRAYHGSPHDFERFDLSKIGTGEGAQAYGHGLYFAEHEPTAQWYRDALSAGKNKPANLLLVDGKPIAEMPAFQELPPGVQRSVNSAFSLGADKTQALSNVAYQREQAIKKQQEFASNPNVAALYRPDYHDAAAEFIKSQPDSMGKSGKAGRMYEVQINADPEHFLDWNKPLSQQSPQVQALAAATNTKPEKLGSDLLAYLESIAGGDKSRAAMASDQLREAGIPGIKYLDQGSRTAGEGSRNYVVFDDKLIDILKKYGLAGLIAQPAASAVANYGEQRS